MIRWFNVAHGERLLENHIMLSMITNLTDRIFARSAALVAKVHLGDMDFDMHVQDYWDNESRLEWEAQRAIWAEVSAAVQARWDAMSADTQQAIINELDDLDSQGRLGDHPYYEQWIRLRTKRLH